MKNIVVNDEYHQSDLKPSDMLEEYLVLIEKDADAYLAKSSLQNVMCPACGSATFSKSFEKFNLLYKECQECQTLYVSPRPNDQVIDHFYRQAPSKIFWRNKLSEASRAKRKAKIIKPRLEWIMDSTAEYFPDAKHWVDIYMGQSRYLELMAASGFAVKTLIYPYCDVSSSFGSLKVIDKPWWEAKLDTNADIVTLFEVIDHTSDVALLLNKVKGMLNDHGLCFITTILASGFDVKELGSNANNIYPPDRLNVFTIKGYKKIFEHHGFECLELSTPGILDLEIVVAALKENPDIVISPFVRDLVLNGTEEAKRGFQEFLQANRLSSYGRILIRKV